jgi:hypothetical protein
MVAIQFGFAWVYNLTERTRSKAVMDQFSWRSHCAAAGQIEKFGIEVA